MRNLRLLLLVVSLASIGSYSALAGAGAPPATHTPSAGSQQTDAGDAASPAVQQQEGEDPVDARGEDKIAQAIANEFGVSKDEVLARHNEGIGFGALFKLYKLARAQGVTVDELLAAVPNDANGERDFAFGERRKALTAEQRAVYESGPKNLGRLVSAASKNAAPPEAEGEPETSAPDDGGAGASGRAPGNGHVPPGLAKKAGGR
jgi:hypothetical protein